LHDAAENRALSLHAMQEIENKFADFTVTVIVGGDEEELVLVVGRPLGGADFCVVHSLARRHNACFPRQVIFQHPDHAPLMGEVRFEAFQDGKQQACQHGIVPHDKLRKVAHYEALVGVTMKGHHLIPVH